MLKRLILALFLLVLCQVSIVAQDTLDNSLNIKYDTVSIQSLKQNPEFVYALPELKASNWFDTLKVRIQNILSWIFASDGFGYLVTIILIVTFISIITVILIKGRFESISNVDAKIGVVFENPLVFESVSPQHQLQLALANKDFRMAFRWRFIIYLKTLSDYGLIKLDSHKSNHDYQRELKGTKWHAIFGKLSRSFDYIWYGHQPIYESEFNKFEDLFNTKPDEIQL